MGILTWKRQLNSESWVYTSSGRLLGNAISPDSRGGGLRTVSPIHLFDAAPNAGIAGHRRSVGWIGSGAKSRRIATGLDCARPRASNPEWNGSGSTNPQTLP